jgi:hypothetical protein
MTASAAAPGEITDAEMDGDDIPRRAYQGYVIIEFPVPESTPEHPRPGILAGYNMMVVNAADEKPVLTVSRVELHAEANDIITADLTMMADADGRPLMDTSVIYRRGDEIVTGTFPFIVTGIRNYGSQQEIRDRIKASGVHAGRSKVVEIPGQH